LNQYHLPRNRDGFRKNKIIIISGIATGFEKSCEVACKRVEAIKKEINVLENDSAFLKKSAGTALGSKIVSSQQSKLADICVRSSYEHA
jgi:chaperonin GroEL (HSP60 family)